MYSKVHSYFVPTYFHVQVLLNCIFCFFLRRRRPNPRETRMVNMATSVHRNPRSYAGNTGRFLAHDLATPSAYCRYDHQPRGAGTGKIIVRFLFFFVLFVFVIRKFFEKVDDSKNFERVDTCPKICIISYFINVFSFIPNITFIPIEVAFNHLGFYPIRITCKICVTHLILTLPLRTVLENKTMTNSADKIMANSAV